MSQVFVGFSGGWGTPKPYVFFKGFRAPRGLWGLQTLRFSHVIWLLGCPGAPTPYVIGFRTPRAGGSKPWVSQVVWLVVGTGVPKPIVFIGVLASRRPWGLQNLMFFIRIRALRVT